MNYFTQLDMPSFPLQECLSSLIARDIINFDAGNQICLNTIPTDPGNFKLGCGSLERDWSSSYTITSDTGIETCIIPDKCVTMHPSDFTVLCTQFKDTVFEEVYQLIKSKYSIGRVRMIKSTPKTCMSWHMDHTLRLHYVVTTAPGCFMVIKDQVVHLPPDTWWVTDTTRPHTAFNGGASSRVHLVAEIL